MHLHLLFETTSRCLHRSVLRRRRSHSNSLPKQKDLDRTNCMREPILISLVPRLVLCIVLAKTTLPHRHRLQVSPQENLPSSETSICRGPHNHDERWLQFADRFKIGCLFSTGTAPPFMLSSIHSGIRIERALQASASDNHDPSLAFLPKMVGVLSVSGYLGGSGEEPTSTPCALPLWVQTII